jgi:hypothetical protein
MTRLGRPNRPARPWLGSYATETENKVVVIGVATRGPAKQAGVEVHFGMIFSEEACQCPNCPTCNGEHSPDTQSAGAWSGSLLRGRLGQDPRTRISSYPSPTGPSRRSKNTAVLIARYDRSRCTPCEVIVDAYASNHAPESDARDGCIGGK